MAPLPLRCFKIFLLLLLFSSFPSRSPLASSIPGGSRAQSRTRGLKNWPNWLQEFRPRLFGFLRPKVHDYGSSRCGRLKSIHHLGSGVSVPQKTRINIFLPSALVFDHSSPCCRILESGILLFIINGLPNGDKIPENEPSPVSPGTAVASASPLPDDLQSFACSA